MNKILLIGNLGKDPEIRYMPSGSAVCNCPLATSEKWKDKESGELKERTEWHDLVFFGRQAEVVCEYLKKGSKVFVEGSTSTRKWQDQSGNDRYTKEVKVTTMEMLDSRSAAKGNYTANAANSADNQASLQPADSGMYDDPGF